MKNLTKTSALAVLAGLSLSVSPAVAAPATGPQVSPGAHTRLATTVESVQADGQVTEAEQEEVVAQEMAFIFDEATAVSADGTITADYPALVERFGEEGAQNALAFVYASEGKTYEQTRAGITAEIQQLRNASAAGGMVSAQGAYSDCVLEKSGFASIVSLTNGTLTAYLNDKNWDAAGKLIMKAAAKNALKLTGVGIVATLTAAAGWCAFTT